MVLLKYINPDSDKTMKKILLLFLPLLTLLSGCTTNFDPKFNSTPVIVINAVAVDGEPVKASVTRSWAAGIEKPDVQLPGATVTVAVNDGAPVLMTYDENDQLFVSEIIPAQGDRVRITASEQKYGAAEGASMVPQAVKISDWTRSYSIITDYDAMIGTSDGSIIYMKKIKFDYTVTFTDPADQVNYYMLSSNMECDDPIMDENYSALDEIFETWKSFYVFSDRQINGKSYTLSCRREIPMAYIPFDEDFKNRIRLYSISKEYYDYLLSLFKKYQGFNGSLEEIGLAEPYQIYTNVSSGAGIVGAESSDFFIDSVIDIVKPLFPNLNWETIQEPDDARLNNVWGTKRSVQC